MSPRPLNRKTRYAVFTEHGNFILSKVPKTHYIACVKDPDLSRVKGIPPHHWILEKDGKTISPMTKPARMAANLATKPSLIRHKAGKRRLWPKIKKALFYLTLAAIAAYLKQLK